MVKGLDFFSKRAIAESGIGDDGDVEAGEAEVAPPAPIEFAEG
jgi:hypothetical protein